MFAGNPDKISEYVFWALWPGGPAYYGEPTPKECQVLNPKDPKYIVRLLFLPVGMTT